MSVRVKVKLYGTLARLAQAGTPGLWCGEIPDGTTVEELIRLLGTRPAEVYAATVDGELRPFETVIPDGAEIVLAPPFGGG